MKEKHDLTAIDYIIFILYSVATLILFCVKAADILKWDWLWVLAPIWAPLIASAIIVIAIFIWTIMEQKVKSLWHK